MRALIVEDEKAAVRILKSILTELSPQYEISGVTDSIIGTVEWLSTNPSPDLVFMDIHLADGSAFEIFERIAIRCPVIFTTAYDEYALKAFKVNSIDYLLKPINENEMRRALDKLELLQNAPQRDDEDFLHIIKSISNRERYTEHFLVPGKGSKLLPLSADSVCYFCISEGETKAVTSEGELYIMPYTLDELSGVVDPERFFRVNRQYLISREAISDIDLWFQSRLSINLKIPKGEKTVVSKARVKEFKMWFAGKNGGF